MHFDEEMGFQHLGPGITVLSPSDPRPPTVTRIFRSICEGRPLRSVFSANLYFTSFYFSLPFLNWQESISALFSPHFSLRISFLAGADHLGPSLPFRFFHFPRLHPITIYFGRAGPFRSVSAFFSLHFSPCHPLFWQEPAI